MSDAALRARYRRILRFAGAALAQTWWFELFLPRIGLGRIGDRGRSARMQRIAQSADEHPGSADLCQRGAGHVTLRRDLDKRHLNAGRCGQRTGHGARLGEGEGAAASAQPHPCVAHRASPSSSSRVGRTTASTARG